MTEDSYRIGLLRRQALRLGTDDLLKTPRLVSEAWDREVEIETLLAKART